MRKIIQQIFTMYEFEKNWQNNYIEFYSAGTKDKTSFFLIDYIDATDEKLTNKSLLKMLKQLENDYIDESETEKCIKRKIQELFIDNVNMAAQIDKNISAIYAIKLASMKKMIAYRNLIYSVEESPNYFRRFVLPYSDNQVDELESIIDNHQNDNIVNILSDIANQEDAYYNLAGHRNLDNAYELVIRLFSKIPFLQYNFIAEQKPMTVKKRIELELDKSLFGYHTLICNECAELNEYIKVSNFLEDDEAVEDEIKKRLNK